MRDPADAIPHLVKQVAQHVGSFTDPSSGLLLPQTSERWRFYLLSVGAMLALAGLDFIGSVFAKEWTLRHHPGLFLAGLATFVVLYVVFAASLRFAELSVVAFGWIVFLQIGLVILDRVRYDVIFPPGKWVAIAVMLMLQAYLVLAPNAARHVDGV
jgi:hypothetical protein